MQVAMEMILKTHMANCLPLYIIYRMHMDFNVLSVQVYKTGTQITLSTVNSDALMLTQHHMISTRFKLIDLCVFYQAVSAHYVGTQQEIFFAPRRSSA